MSNVSTFGGFSTARLGIYAAQKGLEVTGNNISNINTPNYTRQVLQQKALHVGGIDHYTITNDIRVGAGALTTGVAQIRDPYLDIRYRNENANVGAADAKLAGLEQLTAIFDEVGKGNEDDGVLELAMKDLFKQIQAMNTDGAGRDEYNNITRGAAESVVRWFNDYAKQLETLKKNHEKAFRQDIDRVNTVLTGIRDLSEQIRKENIHGGDALELKDERNALIDELSKYMRIHVTYSEEDIGAGMTVEKLKIEMADKSSVFGGVTLLDGIYGAQLSIQKQQVQATDEDGKPLWIGVDGNTYTDARRAELIDGGMSDTLFAPLTEEVDDPLFRLQVSALRDRHDNLKENELYRMQKNGASDSQLEYYEDADGESYLKVGDSFMYGGLQATREMLTKAGEYSTDEQHDMDENCTTNRGIPFYEKALDHLANTFAKWMNDANTVDLARNPELYDFDTIDNNDGTFTYTFYTTDADGNRQASTTFTKAEDAEWPDNLPYKDADTEEAVKLMKTGVLFSNSGQGNDTEGITARNLSISLGWSTDAIQIVNTKDPVAFMKQSTANDNLNHFVAIMDAEFKFAPGDIMKDPPAYLGDQSYFEGSFFGMLTKINSTLAIDTKSTMESLDNYNTAAEDLYLEREGVSGVDLNDETVNMMQYQKSYTAACRLLTTLDEMLERLITGTGLAGR